MKSKKGGEPKTEKRWRAEEVQLRSLLLRAGHQPFLATMASRLHTGGRVDSLLVPLRMLKSQVSCLLYADPDVAFSV
jgi:hypothetical protein